MPVRHPELLGGPLDRTQAIHSEEQGRFTAAKHDFSFVFDPEFGLDLHKNPHAKRNPLYNMLLKAYCQDKPFSNASSNSEETVRSVSLNGCEIT
jgi:hypothetical protein